DRRPVRPRAPGPAGAGRLQADRRRPLRPRRHAGPDDLLTEGPTAARAAGPVASPPATLDALVLDAFRSYAGLETTFQPGPQLVWGPNAAGKTSLLEALVVLAWGHSH